VGEKKGKIILDKRACWLAIRKRRNLAGGRRVLKKEKCSRTRGAQALGKLFDACMQGLGEKTWEDSNFSEPIKPPSRSKSHGQVVKWEGEKSGFKLKKEGKRIRGKRLSRERNLF